MECFQVSQFVVGLRTALGNYYVEFPPHLEDKMNDKDVIDGLFTTFMTNNVPPQNAAQVFPYSYFLNEHGEACLVCGNELVEDNDTCKSPPRKKILLSPSMKTSLAKCKSSSELTNKMQNCSFDEDLAKDVKPIDWGEDLGEDLGKDWAGTSENICEDSTADETDPHILYLAKMSSSVKVEKLPPPFFEDYFKYCLEDAVNEYKEERTIHIVQVVYHEDEKCAIVKFDSPASADQAAALSFAFDNNLMTVTHLPLPKKITKKMTSEVVLSNHPSPFFEADFLHKLSCHMKVIGMEDNDFVRCFDHCPDTSTVVLEFRTPDLAAQFCNSSAKTPMRYRGLNQICSQSSVEEENVADYCNSDTNNNIAVDKVFDSELMSDSVKVGTLPVPFFEDYFKFSYEQAINENKEDTIHIVKVLYHEEDNCATVQFASPAAAAEAAAVKFMFDNIVMSLTHLPLETVAMKMTSEVVLTNQPSPFFKADFLHKLSCHMKVIGMGDNDFVRCFDYSPVSGSVVLEFQTPDLAAKFCKCTAETPLTYRKQLQVCTQRSVHADSRSPGNLHPENVESVENKAFRSDWPYYETAELMKLCNLHREVLRNHRHKDYKATWVQVATDLQAMGLQYDEKAIKKRVAGLVKYLSSTASKDWCMHSLVSEYCGKIAKGTAIVPDICKKPAIKPSETKAATKPNSKKKHFGVVVLDSVNTDDDFSGQNYVKDILLIHEYTKRKQKFDDAMTKATTLYAEIEAVCTQGGYKDLTAEKCSNRMASLATQFKEKYDEVRFGTGVGVDPTQWVYYDEFAQIFEKTAIMEPQKLFSMGTTFSATTRSQEANVYHGRKGNKERVSPPSHKERRVLVGEALVDEFKKMNQMMAHQQKQ